MHISVEESMANFQEPMIIFVLCISTNHAYTNIMTHATEREMCNLFSVCNCTTINSVLTMIHKFKK